MSQTDHLLGLEIAERIEDVENIDGELSTLDQKNRELYDATKAKFDAVQTDLVAKLKDPAYKEHKTAILALKTEVESRRRRFETHFSDFAGEDKAAAEVKKQKEKLAREEAVTFAALDQAAHIPGDEKDDFKRHYKTLPESQRSPYLTRVNAALSGKKRGDVFSLCHFRGTLFELTRRALLIEQGREKLTEEVSPLSVEYFGYDSKSDDPKLDKPPTHRLGKHPKGGIEIDVQGIVRDGRPYVYETKAYPRKKHGFDYGENETVAARNQLLKYEQAASDKDINGNPKEPEISGATVEVRGRIDYDFLRWAIGEKVEDHGAVPHVEIIYNVPLPSGNEYRFVLKRGGKKGLQFKNDDTNYTREDRIVVAGIAQAVRDKSITRLIQAVNIDPNDLPEGLTPEDIEHPEKIEDLGKFRAYEEEKRAIIWHELSGKGLEAKRAARMAPYDSRVTPEYIRHELADFQALLNANPELKALKWAYVLPEDRYDEVVQKVMEAVTAIREYENERQNGKGRRDERARTSKRIAKGYSGPAQGCALDVEHILMDVLQDTNKTRPDQKPRSYNDIGRFHKLEDVMGHLREQDRRYIEISSFDPVKDKHSDVVITGKKSERADELLTELERNRTIENLKRAQTRFQTLKERFDFLRTKGLANLDDAEKAEFSQVQSRLSVYLNSIDVKKALMTTETQMAALQQEKAQRMEGIKTVMLEAARGKKGQESKEAQAPFQQQLREISAEYADKIADQQASVLGVYNTIFAKEWDKFTIREVQRTEANLVKFIYVITPEEDVILDEEQIRGAADSSRAAHSELAQGRNVYAAGELTFEKKGQEWILTEINNGSGHYRPEQDALAYAKAVICEKLGLSSGADGQVQLKNCIYRGMDIDGFSLQ